MLFCRDVANRSTPLFLFRSQSLLSSYFLAARFQPSQFMPLSSTSKMSVAFGGMRPGKPRSPYAIFPGMVRTLRSPKDIFGTPSSHPAITRPTPMAVLKSPRPTELSNLYGNQWSFG